MHIDVHNHVIPQPVLDLIGRDDAYGVRLAGGVWGGALEFPVVEEFFDPAVKLEWMDRAELGMAVVSMAPPAFLYDRPSEVGTALWETANDALAEYCGHAPGRLRWLAHVPMQWPDAAVRLYREAARSGCSGVAVGTSIAGARLDEPQYEEFWAVAGELGLPVLVHPWFNERHAALDRWYLQNAIGNPLETTVVVERLLCSGMLRRHPDVQIILMHGGGFVPYQLGRLCHAQQVRPELVDAPASEEIWETVGRQLWFDTITHDAEALRYLVRRVGEDRVLIGTDNPFDMGDEAPVSTVRDALTADQAEQIGSANAMRLFGLSE